MAERYFGRVVGMPDKYTVVINKGDDNEVEIGQKFLVVGQGNIIIDPETNEELERLELVRGRVSIEHIQQKISTLKSCEYEKAKDLKEIKKVTSQGGVTVFGRQNTVTESITPGKRSLKKLNDARVGDYIIKL